MLLINIVLAILVVICSPVPPMTPTILPHAENSTISKETGIATYYNKGIFSVVLKNRIKWGQIKKDQCKDCVGYVAMLWPEDIGREVCVSSDGITGGPYLVIDVASKKDRSDLVSRGWIIDIDYRTWFEYFDFPNDEVVVSVYDRTEQSC